MHLPFWWLPSWKHRVHLEAKLDLLLSQQQAAQTQLLRAVERMADVSAAQTKAFETWITLFKKHDTVEPRRWTRDVKQENMQFLQERGMPDDLTEAEQADWVRKDLGLI